jgi:hypothetical protein
MKTVPYHKHDCDHCEFLVAATVFGRELDIYQSCEDNHFLVRHSSDGQDYQTVHGVSPVSFSTHNSRMELCPTDALCEFLVKLAGAQP